MSSRKKVRKYRGSKTHGGGAMKKRRGAGSRGGRGRAGSGKRGDQKKPSYWKNWTLGNKGFNSQTRKKIVTINVAELEKQLSNLERLGAAKSEGKSFTVDLGKAGINKLLGSGQVRSAIKVKVDYASASAVEKVSSAGGSVEVLNAPEVEAEE